MAYEVEIKFRAEDHGMLADRLRALGAEEEAAVEQADLYLAHPARDFARTDEALRLRRDGDENCVTYKGPKRGGPTKTREEIEVPFEPGTRAREEMARVFERLGFRPVADIRKARRTFRLARRGRPIAVTLDLAEGLGAFAEVEAIARDEEDLAATQEAVLALAAELGLGDVEPRSYLRMTLEGAVASPNRSGPT